MCAHGLEERAPRADERDWRAFTERWNREMAERFGDPPEPEPITPIAEIPKTPTKTHARANGTANA